MSAGDRHPERSRRSRDVAPGFRHGVPRLRWELHTDMNPILALDFGRARIGAAISDELQLLAHPLETIPGERTGALARRRDRARKES